MDAGRPSGTAFSAARHRAVHQLLESGAVFADPLAVRILGVSERELRADAAAHPERRAMRWFICARSRLADDVAAAAVSAGVRQLLVLGAGLDTFGYRNPHPGLRVVEIDHPATQRWKLERLAAAGIDASPVLRRAVDFESDDLGAALRAAIDPSAPVLVWWLGVTPYLTRDAVRATLSALASVPSVAVVFDHAAPTAGTDPVVRQWHERRRARVAELGEPWLSEFATDEISELARRVGFVVAEPVHERAVIDRALGRSVADVSTPPHLMVVARGWPVAVPIWHPRV